MGQRITDNHFNYYYAQGASNVGKVRTNNEDNFLLMPEEGCFFVADGVGGAEAGEVASKMVVDCLQEKLRESTSDSPGERKYCADQALLQANRMVLDYAEGHQFQSMGSTVVGFLFDTWDPATIWVCHVGDSRAYLMSDGKLMQLTIDHAANKPAKDGNPAQSHGPLTRAIGATSKLEVEWCRFPIHPNDILLLCSDGLTVYAENQELESLLKSRKTIGAPLPDMLIDLALSRGGADNVTVVAIKIKRELPEANEVSDTERNESEYWAKK